MLLTGFAAFKHVTFAISDQQNFEAFQAAYVKRSEALKAAKAAKMAAGKSNTGAISAIEKKGANK